MMKKLITLSAALCMALGASAQLAPGSIAPNWTYTDLDGTTHSLYDYLDQGKTVFIDVSATWCGPCWSYHNSHALRNLYEQHGPSGYPSVSGSTTNDVMVFFIEGDPSTTMADLQGTTTASQGNWITGTTYPIINPDASTTNTFNTNYNVNYFPTIYMVCRDRLITEVGQKNTAELYALSQADCPDYAPSTSTDAKAIIYSGKSYFTCTANPTVKFQNYGATTITSATVKIYSGSTLVATQNWTGSVAPYGVGSVTFASFTPSAFAPYKYVVEVAGDSYAANNTSADSLFVVFNAANTFPIPYTENFSWTTSIPDNIVFTGVDMFPTTGTSSQPVIQADGSAGMAIIGYFWNSNVGDVAEMLIGNYNTASMTTPNLQFDVSYKQYGTTTLSNDKLEVQVSTDCGATWTSVYSKSGDVLATGTATTTMFIPNNANQWRHETVDLSAYKNANLFIRFKTTSDFGNNLFIDNINLSNSLSVGGVELANAVSVFPNPASAQAQVKLELKEAAQVVVIVSDVTGRVVYSNDNGNTAAGEHIFSIPTSTLSAGVYNVQVKAGTATIVKQLSVAK